jgi:hypothetical protein
VNFGRLISVFAALLGCSVAFAGAASDWNGTWVGNWSNGNGAQIIFAGNALSGVYWDGDYIMDAHAALSDDGRVVSITWTGATAVLTRDGDATAHIVIREHDRADAAFVLKKDGG